MVSRDLARLGDVERQQRQIHHDGAPRFHELFRRLYYSSGQTPASFFGPRFVCEDPSLSLSFSLCSARPALLVERVSVVVIIIMTMLLVNVLTISSIDGTDGGGQHKDTWPGLARRTLLRWRSIRLERGMNVGSYAVVGGWPHMA